MTGIETIHAVYTIHGTEDAELLMITDNYLSFKIEGVDVCIQIGTLECSRNHTGHGSTSDAFTKEISARLHRYYADKLGRKTDD